MVPEDKPRAPVTRDAALRRVSHARRWLIAGAVALTGVFSVVASQAFPGRTLKKATAAPAAAAAATPTPSQTPAPTGGDQDQGPDGSGIAPPDQAPQPSNSPDGAVSGGS